MTTGIAHMLAPNASVYTGPGTNTYLVSSRAGPCLVIDPGPDHEGHLREIARAAASHGALQGILLTHQHPDHSDGAARLRAMTGAPILASQYAGTALADVTLDDGEVVRAGERVLRALYTPGHRFDHLCFLLEDARILFAGDVVAGSGTVVIAPPEGDLAAYLASLRRLMTLDLTQILPGHGPAIDAPREKLAEYVAHRLDRERQVLAELRAGNAAVEALVAAIYPDLDPALDEAAALTVTAHLLKLEHDGRVARAVAPGGVESWHLMR